MIPVSHVVPHLCGLPSDKRRTRRLLMYRCFVDDSGRDSEDIALILGAWAARVEFWDTWSDRWVEGLERERRIDYFKNSEARALKGCFDGFTRTEASVKQAELATLLTNVPVIGFIVTIDRRMYKAIVEGQAVRHRGKVLPDLRDPFFVAFHHLVPLVITWHFHLGVTDRIDFIFDGNDSDVALRRSRVMYESIKSSMTDEPSYPLMGSIHPGDDKELMPLQAADLLAGQMRRSILDARHTHVIWMWRDTPTICRNVTQASIEEDVKIHNVEFSTQRLERVGKRKQSERKK
jgi:hypothetical protein